MATLTITLEPTVLEAAKSAAERRKITLDQLIAESLTMVASPPPTDADNEALIRLMNEGILGHIDRPLTRDEIYAERTWPRS